MNEFIKKYIINSLSFVISIFFVHVYFSNLTILFSLLIIFNLFYSFYFSRFNYFIDFSYNWVRLNSDYFFYEFLIFLTFTFNLIFFNLLMINILSDLSYNPDLIDSLFYIKESLFIKYIGFTISILSCFNVFLTIIKKIETEKSKDIKMSNESFVFLGYCSDNSVFEKFSNLSEDNLFFKEIKEVEEVKTKLNESKSNIFQNKEHDKILAFNG